MRRIVRWRGLESRGLEHLDLRLEHDRFVAEALVIGSDGGQAYGLRYRVVCDSGWRAREVSLALVGAAPELALSADGEGSWFDGAGQRLPAFDGCVDLDIAATPFTNTLPIRRLGLREGEGRDIRVVYIPVPALEPSAVAQRYTCLSQGRLCRYEGFPPGFSADLEVDEDGLVTDYPGLFQRVL